MSTKIYCDGDSNNTIAEKSSNFIRNIFKDNPEIESVFVPTTKGIEVMFSIEDGKITGFWNSEHGDEDYAEIESFLEIYKLEQYQSVSDIVSSAF